MAQVGGRVSVAMMETLEGRQLLSFDALAPITDGDAEQSPIALTATTNMVAAGATVTSLHIASTDVEEGSPVTLDAVVRTHGSLVAVTGSVAFLAIATPDDAPRYVGFAEVEIARAGAHGPEMAFVLGTAAVAPDGTARLELSSLPLGPHSIVAMFLGEDAPIFAPSGDLPRILASSEPQTLVTWTPNGPEEVRSWIVELGGKGFRIRSGMIEFLEQAPEDAESVPVSGVHLNQIEWYRDYCSDPSSTWCADRVAPAATFAPAAQPLRVIATARGGTSRAAYVYEIVPVGLPEAVQDKSEGLSSSASEPELLEVRGTTHLKLRVDGETTVTNPPAISAALRRIAGPLEYHFPVVPTRGTIQSASAGLRVTIPSTGGSSGTGGVTYGAGMIFGGQGSSYRGGNVYISVRQPRLPKMTGTLTFFDRDVLLASVPLTESQNALFHIAPGSLALGAHQIRVVYSGDAAHRAQEGTIEVQIRKTPTELKLESSVPSGTTLASGAVLDLKATVSTLVKDLVKPTGYVKFFANGKRIGQVLLGSESTIQFQLPGGSYEITAVYAGNETMKGSRTASGAVLNFNVEPSATTVSAIVKSPVKRRNRPIVLTPIVSPSDRSIQPRGKVVVEVNGRRVGSGRTGSRIKLKLGHLREGMHSASVRYLGDESTRLSWSEYQVTVTRTTVSIAKAPPPAPVPSAHAWLSQPGLDTAAIQNMIRWQAEHKEQLAAAKRDADEFRKMLADANR